MTKQPVFFTNKTSRKASYRLKTYVRPAKDGYTVEKHASKQSEDHLQKIVETYKKVSKLPAFTDVRISKATKKSAEVISFSFLEGVSLERKIIESFLKLDESAVLNHIDRVFHLIESLPQDIHNPQDSKEFADIFGGSYASKTPCTSIGLIDLNFDNFVVDNNDTLGFFDYEWRFDLSIPLEYLKTRSLWYLLVRHQNTFMYYQHKVELVTIGELLVPKYLHDRHKDLFMNLPRFIQAEASFQNRVSLHSEPQTFGIVEETKATDHQHVEIGIDRVLSNHVSGGIKKMRTSVDEQKSARKQAEKELKLLKSSTSYRLAAKASKARARLTGRK